MEGVTSKPYRDLLAADADVVCTEFVRITRTKQRKHKLSREVQKSEGAALSVQVMGRDVEQMRSAAEVMAEAGADIIDINLGCPSRNAAKGGVGAAMLKDPDLVYTVCRAMRAVTPKLLSAKIRAGFDASDTPVVNGTYSLDTVQSLCEALVAAEVDFITVHPRRRNDGYSGTADWRIVRTLKERLDVPIGGNGDCWYATDAERMLRETGCDFVMLGRGVLRNPFLLGQIRALAEGRAPMAPTGADVVDHVHRLHDAFVDFYGRSSAGKLKEHLRFLLRALPQRNEVRRDILSPQTIGELLEATERLFAPLSAEQIDLGADGSLGLETSGGCGLVAPIASVPPRSFVSAG